MQVLNLFLALLLNAFDSGDEEEEEGENEDDDDESMSVKKLLGKLTQTRKTSVFPVQHRPSSNGSCSCSQEIQAFGKENEGKNIRRQNMGKEYSTVGKFFFFQHGFAHAFKCSDGLAIYIFLCETST